MTTVKEEIVIRKAAIEDLDALRAFARQVFHSTYAAYNTEENMQYYRDVVFSKQHFEKDILGNTSVYYIAKDNGAICGYIKLNFSPAQTDLNDPSSIELERIYVADHLKGKGLGKALLNKAVEIGVQHGKQYLWLGVWEHNANAMRFYEKNGFVPFSTHVFMLGADEQKDILMKKNLD